MTIADRQVERAERILGSRMEIVGRAEGGGVAATFRCNHIEDVRQLLAFGNSVTVHDPPQVRRRLRELALEIADHYG